MRALIVEDDERISTPLKEELQYQHYLVDVAADGALAFEMATRDFYNLILLDVMLPKLDGLSLCRKLRQSKCTSAIVMITARDKTQDKIMGLDAGADDYLVKPFELDELSARVRAVLRRNSETRDSTLRYADLVLDPQTCLVTNAGQVVELTPTEFRLLEHFMRNSKRTFNKDQLIARLWKAEESPTEDVVKAHIKGLRNKLSKAGVERDLIETVYGFGYRMKLPPGV